MFTRRGGVGQPPSLSAPAPAVLLPPTPFPPLAALSCASATPERSASPSFSSASPLPRRKPGMALRAISSCQPSPVDCRLTPLESALTDTHSVSPLESALTEKPGGGTRGTATLGCAPTSYRRSA